MNTQQSTQLERLKNYKTRYEVTAKCDETTLFIGYTAKHSRLGVLSCFRGRASRDQALLDAMQVNGSDRLFDAPNLALRVNAWTVGFTGRTQREAITEGELP